MTTVAIVLWRRTLSRIAREEFKQNGHHYLEYLLTHIQWTPLKVILNYIMLHTVWHGAKSICLCNAAAVAVLWWQDVHLKRKWCQVLSVGMLLVLGCYMAVPPRMLSLWLAWEWLHPTLGKRAASQNDPEWHKKKCLRTMEDLEPYNDYLQQLLANNPDMDVETMHGQLEHDKQETVEMAAIKK